METVETRRLFSTIYVDANSSGPAHDGTSWASAYLDLQLGLAAAVSGDQIRVADGTYKPTSTTDRTISFQLKTGVSLLGGYAGFGAIDPNARNVSLYPCVLSGDIGTAGNNSDNSYHVVIGSGTDGSAVLDGFSVTAGNANGANSLSFGGGMYNLSGSPTVANCTFSGNSVGSRGAGMYSGSGSPTITNCVFTGNSASADSSGGGGMYNSEGSATITNCTFSGNSAGTGGGMVNSGGSAVVSNCTFSGNSALYGGGMYGGNGSLTITNCIFSGNSASGPGGAIANDTRSPAITNCIFSGNSARSGGGIYNYSSKPTLNNCTFSRNSASTNGGGMYLSFFSAATLSNCTFNGNSASGQGGGTFNERSSPTLRNCSFSGNSANAGGGMGNSPTLSSPTLINCTFSGNAAVTSGGGIYNPASSKLRNCIVWGNDAPTASQIHQTSGTPSISYSDIQGGWTGAGNIDANPLFLRNPSPGADATWGTGDDDYGDLRLQAASPCIDSGDNSAVPAGVVTDLAGNPRIVDAPNVQDFGEKVDMGAFEYVPPLTYQFDTAKPTLRMIFTFDVNVATLSLSDLSLLNITTGQPLSTNSAIISYDAATRTATWQLDGALPDGQYRATILAGSVSDLSGTPLADDALCNFFILGGDANRDRTVDINDLSILATNWNGSGKFFSQGDFNYDGKVDAIDLGILSRHWQQTLPPPQAQPTRLTVNPTRKPTRMVSVVG